MSNIALGLYKYVDGVNDTPFPSSANQAFLVDWQYGARRMGGAPSITGGTINHTICLDNDWSMDVYVEYKGEKFFPSHKPTSSYSAQSITYEHKVDFYSERLVLDNVYFYDVVSSGDSGGKPVSNSTKFTFFGNITEFIARLNASMQRANTGYSAVLDPNQVNADLEKQIKFDTKYISEALQEGFKAFGIPYYFVGKVCHYGDSQSSAIDNIVFEYGKDNSLMSIEKTNANTKIVNRITGVGSGDNIPYYYPNSCEQGVVDIANLSSSTITELEIFDDMLFAKKVKRDAVLTYNTWSFNVETPIFYLDGKPYTNGKGFTSDEIAQGQALHVVVPFEVKYDGCTDLVMRFSVSPVATIISNISLSPAISGVTPTANNGVVYVNAVNKNIAKGKYQLAFDVNISTFSLILQTFKTESCTIYANGWKDNKDGNFYKDLEEIGIMMTGTASANDNFKQVISKYIPPQSNLMPSIYRNSDGDERFYNAANNTYVNPDTGEYYEFPNPYANGKPKEFIKDYKDVKPTIAGAVNSASEPIDQIIKFAYDANDNDETDEEGNYIHPYFFALLHKTNGTYGFNLFDHTIDEGEMSLSFTSGRMGGCEFVIGVGEDSQKNLVQIVLDGNLQPQLDEDGHPILARDTETGDVICGREGQGTQIPQDWQNDTRRNEVWVALKKDITTYGVIMPNATNNYRPSDDEVNEFVILHIDLPKAYILAAEQSIDNLLISYMAESNTEHWNFGIDFSRIYLKDTPNIANALDENKKIKIRYNGEIYSRYVLGYTYKTLIGEPLPSISIELAESLEGSSSALDTAINEINNMVEQQAQAMIGYQQVARLARGALQASNVEGAGSSTRPIYFDGHEAKTVDGIEVPENIRTQKNVEAMWGVAAYGMASLAINGGGGQGTVTAINFAGSPERIYTPSDGLITLPDYPTAASLISDGLASQDYVASYFASNFTQSNIKNTLGISDWALAASKPSYAFSEITGTASDSQIPTLAISKISGLQTALDGKLATSLKGAANGLAELDANGLVPSSQLPSYVDDVLEYASKSAFPATGETGKIYVALDTNLTWRWSGSAYVEISPSLALGETSSTAYRGDRGKTAYDHATDASRLTTAQSSGFYKFATTAEGHIASVTAVTASDLTTLIGSTTYAPYNADGYLPLSGGTIDADFGALKVKTSNSSSWAGIELLNSNGNSLGYYASSVNNGEPWWVTGGQTAAYPILHSGNYTDYTVQKDGTGASGTWGINITGDADTVDGYHQSDFYRAKMGSLGGVNAADVPVGSHWVYTQLGTSNPVAMTYSSLYTLGRDYYSVQLNVSYNGSRALLRGVAHGSDALTVFNWHELAFLDSNVASATYATSAGNADTVDNEHASAFAHVGTDNNLIAHGNEFNFVPSGYNGDVYVNWRTTGGENGAIRSYYFVDGARNYSPVLFCGGVYKYNYGSSAYVLTSDGGAAAISQMRVGEANGLNPISSAPDNATGNGYDAVTWFSWNLGGIANTSYACGITIGSNPSDPAYGFQIGQELWYDRLYVRRRNSGSWANWKSIAYLDDTVDSANYLVGCTTGTDTGNWDANNPSNKDYLWYYGQDGGVSHAPFANSYGSIVNFFSNGNGSGLNGQLAFGILHDATQNLSTDIWWRAKNNQGWDDRWHRLYDDNHHPLADAATQLQTSRSIWGQSFNGTGDINGNIEIQATGSNFDEGVRIHMASSGFCGVTLCGSDNTGSSGTSANTWSIYNYQGKFGIFQNTSVIDSNNTSGLCGYNGNWGIGTNSPSYKLDVNGSFRAGLVEIPTGQNIINSLSGYALYLNATRSDNVLLAYGGGNVGIGTTSPSYKLHVAGDIYANGGWLRTSGSAGWYSETYGGGWYCDDYTYVKTYGDRSIYTASNILANGNIVANGGVAAGGILNLAYNGAGTQGTLTEIQINGRALTDYSGIVNIPLANTTSTGDGAMSHSDKLKLDGIATGATNVNTDTVAGWGYVKDATGIANALGYIAARENKKSRLVTGNEYRFQTGDNDCINIWIVSAASVNLYLPYDWDYQTPLRLIIANAYSGSVTVNYKATSGTQKIYSQSDTISLPLGRAALVEMIQFYNASVGGEVTFVTMSSYLQRSIT